MSLAPEIKIAEQRLSAQALSRDAALFALDSVEHRATLDPVAGGNGSSAEVAKVRRAREKTKPTVRDVA
jgi:hypothetical protein